MFWNRREEERPRKKRGCLWTIIVCVVLYIVFCGILGAMFGSMFSTPETKLKAKSVYRLDMKGSVVEQAQEANPFASLAGQVPYASAEESIGLDDILSNIKLAKEDARIEGIYLKGGNLSVSPASAKAIRDALIDFKSSGKWIIAYADSYSQMNYYIVSVADPVCLNPQGSLSWCGLGGNKGYFKRILDKLGVEMQVLKVGTFKSAVEPYIRTSMSEADRKQTEVYLYGIWNHMTAAVSESRGIEVAQLNQYADEVMDLQEPTTYMKNKLVDVLVYVQDVDSIIKGLVGTKDFHIVNHNAMCNVARPEQKAKDKIAVVYAEGEITDDSGNGIVATDMVKTLKKVQKNKDVKAVVFRVNSPGGSAYASEQIWHALKLIQADSIPVVVSMSDLAASGGYYISCGADYIFAEPTTITGSIGIFGLIPNFAKLRDKVGYDVDGVGTNKHSLMASNMMMKGMNEEERAMMQAMIERGYDTFTRRCAAGRHMPQSEIKKIGEGRVWLGQDALQLGLVDELGNIDNAIAKAAALAGIEDYALVTYPEKKDAWAEMLKMFDNTTDEEKMIAKFRELVKEPRILMLAPVVEIK
ncbi:MAG: signal peptide peptidase SppA [Paludibacteraceae bacterium]|nr:signal peptide peptidase SppA [Paludibacteraceae bacterium]